MKTYRSYIALCLILVTSTASAVTSSLSDREYFSAHLDWSIQGERSGDSTTGDRNLPGNLSIIAPLEVARNDYNTRNIERTYITYTKTNPTTNKVFTGRTSGFGSPADILNKMDAAHHMNAHGFGPAQLDRASNNKYVIRSQAKQLRKAYSATDRNAGPNNTIPQ